MTGGKSDDFGTAFGDTVAKAPVVWNGPPTSDGTNTTFTGKGANAAFLLPKAGTYAVTMPKTFTLLATNASGGTVATAPCTTASAGDDRHHHAEQAGRQGQGQGRQVGQGRRGRQPSRARSPTSTRKTGGPVPTGKVIIKDGKKNVGKGKRKNGKFTIKVKSLTVGKHKLAVIYKGDDYTDKARARSSRSPSPSDLSTT